MQSGLARSRHYSIVCIAAGSHLSQSLTWASVHKELRSVPLDWFTDAHASADSELENVKPDVKHSNSTSPHAASAIILVSDMLGHLEGANAVAACLQGKDCKCASGNFHVFAAQVCRYNFWRTCRHASITINAQQIPEG